MRSHYFVFVVFVFAVVLASSGFTQQSAEQLYQSGLYKEEVEGNLEKSIEIYERIIRDFPENREIAAKAQLHIGLCYEKLGLRQAQNAYQKVVDNFLEQKEAVNEAKVRLTTLSKALVAVPHKPKFRKIQIPVKIAQGAQLSPDGKKLTFSSRRYEGSIWTVPIPGKVSPDLAGEPSKLIGEGNVWTWGHVWSHDGKWIAYNYLRPGKDIFVDEIHVIPSSGSEPIKIPVPVNRGGSFHLFQYNLSLSPDGKVLAYASKEEGKSDKPKESYIYTIPVNGGTAKRLADSRTWLPAFSPDGKKIAYVKAYSPEEKGPWFSDIWVIPANGGRPVKISDLGGRARRPIWSPDGNWIAFLHEPKPDDECKEIWLVPVSDAGKPSAPPRKIDLPLTASLNLVGWTLDNKIGLLLQNPVQQAIYSVPSSGGKATQVTSAGGHPSWSPDGKRLFFYMKKNICSTPSEGGKVAVVSIEGNVQDEGWYSPCISPDGKTIVFPGFKKNAQGAHIWTVPAKGGEATQLTNSPGTDVFPSWSPDSEWIIFCRQQKKEDEKTYKTDLYIVPAKGGEVKQLTFSPDEVERISAWSPDGRLIAYGSGAKEIKAVSPEGGEPKILVKRQRGGGFSWSPDGKKIVYGDMGKIFVIYLDEGESTEVNTGLEADVLRLSWSPDGKKIAFDARKGGDYEFYLMENFLPLVEKSKK